MWVTLGIILLVYAIFAIVILLRWRQELYEFLNELLQDTQQVLEDAQDVLSIIQNAAVETRSVAAQVDGVANQISVQVPPVIASALIELGSVQGALTTLTADISSRVTEIIDAIRAILLETLAIVDETSQNQVPQLADVLKDFSAQLDELDTYTVNTESRARAEADGVTAPVMDKLDVLHDIIYPDRVSLENEINTRLTPAEITAFAEKILDAARNPLRDEDVVELVKELADTLVQIGGDLLPDTADSVENLADGYVALVTLLVGPHAPFALALRGLLDVLIGVLEPIRATKIQINEGQWLNTRLRLPPQDMAAGLVAVPKGLIHFGWHKRILGKKIGFDFSLPNDDFKADIKIANRGDWLDERLQVPPINMELFNGSILDGVLPGLTTTRVYVAAIVSAVVDATETHTKLKDSAAKMRVSGEKLKSMGENQLPTQADKLRELAVKLLEMSEGLMGLSETLSNASLSLQTQLTNLTTAIDNFKQNTLDAINAASQSITDLTSTLTAFDIVPMLQHIRDASTDISEFALILDDGTPISTSGKNDLVQKIYNILQSFLRVLPSFNDVRKVIHPLFAVLLVLHVAVGLVGIWLMFNFS